MSKKFLLVSNLVAGINPVVVLVAFVMNECNSECSIDGDQDHPEDKQAPDGPPFASSKTCLVRGYVHLMLLHFLLQEKKY